MTESQITSRLAVLRKILMQGGLSSQEDLRESLRKQGFKVTQATISRDLHRLGAVRELVNGGAVYRLSGEGSESSLHPPRSLQEMVMDIVSNDSMIVIHTTPGSASLVARQLDFSKPAGILGTIAGDDTIFVAPPARTRLSGVIQAIRESLA